ncbi:MAG: hypothetical protein B0D92_07250 [Spirochaeta sp. LUC14_002_19_P3]|nr:MAG: hypothetical protein B0D92_07250 [Spirochaeta sp. LUC14_002_19_P3]
MNTAPIDDSIREQFPLLMNYPNLAYLDNAASTQKPLQVLTAMDNYYRNSNANVHRALYSLAERSTAAFEDARSTVQRWLRAETPREVIFTRGTTEALNLLAWSLSELLVEEGDIILVSTLEHHSNFVPWQQAAARKGAELVLIPVLEDSTLNLDFLDTLERDGRSERVKIVSLVHVSNAFGTVNPVREVSKWCKKRDIPLVLDAAQSVQHLPEEAMSSGADFLAFSAHKIYGPLGCGVLWGREKWLERMPPWQSGGEMISSVKLERSTWNELPYKFEAGTPNPAAAVGLAAALGWIAETGMERLETRAKELENHAFQRLSSLSGITLYGPSQPKRRRGVFSFNIEGVHSHDAAQFLDTQGIAIRSGHHCAQPAMRCMGIPSTARASLAPYNTLSDINRLIDAILKAKEYFK